MGLFLVQLGAGSGFTRREGVDTLVVSAEDATDAKEAAKAYRTGDASDAAWAAATATALTDVTVNTATALIDWVFRILVEDPADNSVVADVSFTGVSADDQLDEIGAELATLLNATASIANAAYVAGTQTLTVATGSGGDDLGDMRVTVFVTAPQTTLADGTPVSDPIDLSSVFVASITDEGVATDALTVVFVADTVVVPRVLAALKST